MQLWAILFIFQDCVIEKERTNALLTIVSKSLFTKMLLPLVKGGLYDNHFNEI